MKKNPLIDAILFDLGSTLIYFNGQMPEILAQAYTELTTSLLEGGYSLDKEVFLKEFVTRIRAYHNERETEFIEHTTERILRIVLERQGYTNISSASLRPFLARMYAVTQSCWTVEEDTISMLNTLQKTGYRLGIISNAGDDWDVQVLIDNAGIRSFFEYINTSAAAGIRKPHPKIFQKAFDSMHIAPDHSVMVGDTLGADILGAKNLGMHNVWITRRASKSANKAHIETVKPDQIIENLSELPGLLETWPV